MLVDADEGGGGGGEWAIPSSKISSSKAWIFGFLGGLGFAPPNNNNGVCRDLFLSSCMSNMRWRFQFNDKVPLNAPS